jgi:hypothetical protein
VLIARTMIRDNIAGYRYRACSISLRVAHTHMEPSDVNSEFEFVIELNPTPSAPV